MMLYAEVLHKQAHVLAAHTIRKLTAVILYNLGTWKRLKSFKGCRVYKKTTVIVIEDL